MTDNITLPRSVVKQALNALWATDAEEGTEAYSRELEAIKALRAALEQPQVEQEPVAYVGGHRNGWFYLNGRPKVKIGDALYAAPQPPRQPLTDEEIFNAIRPLCNNDTNCHAIIGLSIDEYRAIERAHGIGG